MATIKERWLEWLDAHPEISPMAYEHITACAEEAGVEAAEVLLVMMISHALDIHPAEVAAEVIGEGVRVLVQEGDAEPQMIH